jgi:hypothetical protein
MCEYIKPVYDALASVDEMLSKHGVDLSRGLTFNEVGVGGERTDFQNKITPTNSTIELIISFLVSFFNKNIMLYIDLISTQTHTTGVC